MSGGFQWVFQCVSWGFQGVSGVFQGFSGAFQGDWGGFQVDKFHKTVQVQNWPFSALAYL